MKKRNKLNENEEKIVAFRQFDGFGQKIKRIGAFAYPYSPPLRNILQSMLRDLHCRTNFVLHIDLENIHKNAHAKSRTSTT